MSRVQWIFSLCQVCNAIFIKLSFVFMKTFKREGQYDSEERNGKNMRLKMMKLRGGGGESFFDKNDDGIQSGIWNSIKSNSGFQQKKRIMSDGHVSRCLCKHNPWICRNAVIIRYYWFYSFFPPVEWSYDEVSWNIWWTPRTHCKVIIFSFCVC